MQPRILVVYCHPNPASFTRAVHESVLAGLARSDCDVQVLDLYDEHFEPALVVDAQRRRRDLDKVEATRPHREQIAWCDAMVFIYPVWWGGFPAMLKGYIDRTFVSGLTYSFQARPRDAVLPDGLMRGKEAHFFYTLDSPAPFALVDPGWLSNYFTVFRYCGFRAIRRYYLPRLKLTTPEQRARWLERVQAHAAALGARLARRQA